MNISENFHDVKDLLNVLTNLKIPYKLKGSKWTGDSDSIYGWKNFKMGEGS